MTSEHSKMNQTFFDRISRAYDSLRMRVNISAMGSVIITAISILYCYQLDLTTPGTSPFIISSRSLLRDKLNLR